MKQPLLTCALVVALGVCLAGAFFIPLSPVGSAHAATARAAVSCPGITWTTSSGGKTWYDGSHSSTTSCNDNTLELLYQNDNNFVLYCNGSTPLWSTKTNTSLSDIIPDHVSFQGDGNFVLYYDLVNPSLGTFITEVGWASGTNNKSAAKLVLQGDANLVIYNSSDKAIWASNTSGKC